MRNQKSLSFALVYLFMLLIAKVSAQSDQYLHSSIDIEVGGSKLQDYTSVRPFNVEFGYRYMATPIVGAKLSFAYNRMYEQWEFKGPEEPIQFVSGTLMGVVNAGRLFQMENIFNNKVTILTGIGGNLSHSTGSTNSEVFFRTTNFHLATFADLEFKVSQRIFLRTGINMVGGINVERDNFPGETTNLFNFNVGVTIALGNSNKEHADFWIPEERLPVVDTVLLQPTIIDKTITNNITKECNCKSNEYVFFDHDKYIINRDGLNAILKSSDKVIPTGIITVIGYASPPGSSDYNIKLAEKRALAVVDYLISTGVRANQIKLIFKGEQDTIDGKHVDLSRRVELIVK